MADDLEQYGQWLEALGADVLGLCEELTAAGPEPVEARSLQVGVVNLVLASLDFLPDGVEELGYLSDAFVLRVACALAVREGAAGAVACRLAREADGVARSLEPIMPSWSRRFGWRGTTRCEDGQSTRSQRTKMSNVLFLAK
jgi:uncharacterized membrane protein YkvA (DUF1232 family)